jgi:tetratricopeptide (TPR) repeat protein
MHKTLTLPALVLLALPTLVGCGKFEARVELKRGNELYKNEQYSQALKQFQRGIELDPDATFAWRSVGLTALALYRPGDESPKNVAYGKQATEAFEKYLADYPKDEKVRDYLLSTYVNAKRYNEALAYLDRRAAEAPQDAPKIAQMKLNIYTQAGRLDDAWTFVKQHPEAAKAETYYSLGVAAWDKSYHDSSLDPTTRNTLIDNGLDALDKALKLKPEYFEAMVYTNLLYREKAKAQTDANLRTEFTAKADEWQQKAIALRKKTLGVKPGAPPPPPPAPKS